jgi:hypothetical protein
MRRLHLLSGTCALTAFVAVCTSVVSSSVVAAAQDQLADAGSIQSTTTRIRGASELPRIRIHRDGRIEQLIADGLGLSPTFRDVVERLNNSDVVVYVRGHNEATRREDGYLQFIGTAAGYRYLQAHIRYSTSRAHQIALIGHELFHAVEVAAAASVIDVPSFAREYARIGFVSHTFRVSGAVAYDTHAAIRTGDQILRELTMSPKQRQLANGPLSSEGDKGSPALPAMASAAVE